MTSYSTTSSPSVRTSHTFSNSGGGGSTTAPGEPRRANSATASSYSAASKRLTRSNSSVSRASATGRLPTFSRRPPAPRAHSSVAWDWRYARAKRHSDTSISSTRPTKAALCNSEDASASCDEDGACEPATREPGKNKDHCWFETQFGGFLEASNADKVTFRRRRWT